MNSVDDNQSLDKPFPGCMGRMVNLFDLNAGMPGNRLISDKPHRDGSPRRSQSDVMKSGQFRDQIEDNLSLQIVSKHGRDCSSRTTNGTPMKMLIAREMSREQEFKHNPPSVVARLMGLDTLPQQEPGLATQRSNSRGYARTNSDSRVNYLQQDKEFWDAQKQHEIHNYTNSNEYKDVYEIMQQSQKLNRVRDKSPHKATCDAPSNDRKAALVREKFIEAKRLSTDEKLRQSPLFDDALEVLNSNKDLFLKFLQEPNIFSQRLQNLQPAHSQHETKRITLLKPCKMVDNARFAGLAKNGKQARKGALANRVDGAVKNHLGLSSPAVDWKLDDNLSQPTRIVVLKPSSGKAQDIKAVVSPMHMSARALHDEELVEETDDFEAKQSGEVAKEITPQMSANLSRHCRDEFLPSSVFSNGYVGDESSFRKSETEFVAGNISDSEVMSPASRHSWDYVSRYGSHHSVSSFSRASYSPDSSVCKEAKKRLSERWAMMTSAGNHHEPRHILRSSSTLGEMLALSDTKNEPPVVDEGYKEDPKESTLSCISDLNKNKDIDKSSRSLIRSKSVPVSSTVFGTGINVDASNQEASKTDTLKEAASNRSVKKSLKGKVSSLFFSRNRNAGKGKSSVSQSKDESQTHETYVASPAGGSNDRTQCDDSSLEDYSILVGNRLSDKVSSQDLSGNASTDYSEVGWSVTKHLTNGNASENQDQPSPISVLETTFEYEPTATESSGNNDPEHGRLLVHSKYNLIDKSPPIGSIARTLSWDDSCMDTSTPYPLQTSFSPHRAEEEEREWFSFVQTLLSVAGLDGEMQADMFLARLYSSDSPLDPSLADKYVDLNGKETVHETKIRQRRSIRRLVFDCVNAALLDIAGYWSDPFRRVIITCNGPKTTTLVVGGSGRSIIMVDQVWARMKEWFSGEERCVAVDYWDSNNQVVERVVKKEVVGKGWEEHLRVEMDNIEVEIERRLLEELLQETVVELVSQA